MSHNIEAIVTKDKPIQLKLETLDLPIFSENGFHIIPLDVCHATYWGKQWKVYEENGEHFGGVNLICIRTIERIANEVGIANFALIATEYHAGIGNQAARVYQNNNEIKIEGKYFTDNRFGLIGVDINSALNAIGVTRLNNLDEFDSINLSNYRSFEKYFEKYEFACEEE